MLTAEGCAARRQRLWASLPSECDTLILADPQSLVYFANFFLTPFVFRTSDAGGILVLQRDRATLVTDSMVKVYADRAHVDEVVAPTWYDGKHSAPHRKELLVQSTREVLAKLKGERFGVERGSVPAGVIVETISFVALDAIVRQLRRVKDADELGDHP